jgi:hypothetical protein
MKLTRECYAMEKSQETSILEHQENSNPIIAGTISYYSITINNKRRTCDKFWLKDYDERSRIFTLNKRFFFQQN